jgi:hypothetical protein
MKTTKSILVVFIVLLTAQIASAYYCPSTGRWPNRDPLGDWAFLRGQLTGKALRFQQNLIEQSLLPSYLFVANDPIDNEDFFGLKILQDMNWQTATCTAVCCNGISHTFTARWYGFRVTRTQGQGCCDSAAFIFCVVPGSLFTTALAQLNFQNCMSSASMPPLMIL